MQIRGCKSIFRAWKNNSETVTDLAEQFNYFEKNRFFEEQEDKRGNPFIAMSIVRKTVINQLRSLLQLSRAAMS